MKMNLQVIAPSLPIGSLDAYIARVNQIPMLTLEEEQELAHRLQQDGDLVAAKQLVMAHLRYVVRVSRGYLGYGLPLGDLIQEGSIGLMKAVKRFNPTLGVRLVSFAVHWIKAEIHEFILRNWRIVKVATTKAQRKLFFNLRKYKKRLGWLSASEIQHVAEDLGVSPKEVERMEQRLNAMDPAFESPVGDNDDESCFSPEQYLEDKAANPALLAERDDWGKSGKRDLSEAMVLLDNRSRNILQRRWLAEKKATLHDLAGEYQVSAERIRQLEQNAIKKLRHLIENAHDL